MHGTHHGSKATVSTKAEQYRDACLGLVTLYLIFDCVGQRE